jgi:hypothetical protein
MFIVATKLKSGDNMDIANASVEYAFRVVSKVTGAKLYSMTNTWVMRVPPKLGDMDLVRKFYIYEPKYIRTDNDIPSEVEGAKFYKEIGGSKDTMGYGFLKDVLEEHYVPFDLIDEIAL